MNSVLHIFDPDRDIMAQPYVACPMHVRTSQIDCAPSRREVRVLGDTNAMCHLCYKRDQVVRPLAVLEALYHEDKDRYSDLSIVAIALGYQSLEDAFMQLSTQRKLDMEDRALLEGCAVVE